LDNKKSGGINEEIERIVLSFKNDKLKVNVFDEIIFCTKPSNHDIMQIFSTTYVKTNFSKILRVNNISFPLHAEKSNFTFFIFYCFQDCFGMFGKIK